MSATGRGSERRAHDAYYTPDRLAEQLVALLPMSRDDRVLEPHGGDGAFVRALAQRGLAVDAGTLHAERRSHLEEAGARRVHVGDFLAAPAQHWDWIVGNPPYEDAERHVRKALELAGNVAFLLRLGFLESRERQPLWLAHMPHRVWALSARPTFGTTTSDKTPYGWFWWKRGHTGPSTLQVLDWDNDKRRHRRRKRSSSRRWSVTPADARDLVKAIGVRDGDRVAVPGGRDDALFGALASHKPQPLDTAETLALGVWDRIVGAPPTSAVPRLVPEARARLRAGGSLTLLLPLHALESKKRAPFWHAHPPRRVEVLTTRPAPADGIVGAHAMALFRWTREPATTSSLAVIDVLGKGAHTELIDRLQANPRVRAIHRDDVRLADVAGPLASQHTSLGRRLDELAAARHLNRTTLKRLQILAARLEELDRMSLDEELTSLLRAVCPDEAAVPAVAHHLGWARSPSPSPAGVADLAAQARSALSRVQVYAPALADLVARAEAGEPCPELDRLEFLPRLRPRAYRRGR